MQVPLIPAPVAICTMMVGLMIGIMIGRKKAMMHAMEPGMGWGEGDWGHWAMRKKMMRKMMAAHHHHGDGMPACTCESEDVSAAAQSETGE